MGKILLVVATAVLLFGTEVRFITTKGNFIVELREDIAPKTVKNFVTLAKQGYYNGVIFHRVIKNFMIQSGDPTGTGRGGESIWNRPFEDEFKPNVIFDKSGILAMANRGPNTNGSQFFITTVPTYWLNGRHTIFGYVKSGMHIIKKIEHTPVDRRDRPIKEVKIIKMEILDEK